MVNRRGGHADKRHGVVFPSPLLNVPGARAARRGVRGPSRTGGTIGAVVMSRNILKVVLLSVMVVAGWVGLNVYDKHFSSDHALNEEREKRKAAEARAEQLNQVVQHLGSEQRVAKIVVLD